MSSSAFLRTALAAGCLLALAACRTGATGASPMPLPDSDWTARWARIDSLRERARLPRSAEAELRSLRGDALAGGRDDHAYRATVRLAEAVAESREPGLVAALEELESAGGEGTPAYRALVHALRGRTAAEWMNRERWRLLDRGQRHGAPAVSAAELPTADLGQAVRYVADAFDSAFARSAALQAVAVDAFPAGLAAWPADSAPDGRALRPTLYDLAAHAAAEFFGSAESGLAQPLQPWTLEAGAAFALPGEALAAGWPTPDSLDYRWRAWRRWLDLEAFRYAGGGLDALRGTELRAALLVTGHRLAFAARVHGAADRDARYREALERLHDAVAPRPEAAEVALALAQAWNAAAPGSDPASDHRTRAEAWAERALAHESAGPAAEAARALLAALRRPVLGLTVEESLRPNTAFPVLLRHANLERVHFRVVEQTVQNQGEREEDYGRRLYGLRPARQWSVALEGGADHNPHTVEWPVEGLPAGRWMLLASGTEGYDPANGAARVELLVTRLALVQRPSAEGGIDLLALDRDSGEPLPGTEIRWVERRWNRDRGAMDTVERGRTRADAEGEARFSALDGYRSGWLEAAWTDPDGQRHEAGGQAYAYGIRGEAVHTPRAWLFTDRALYRPGQTIHVKAIALRGTAEGPGTALAGRETVLLLEDPNGRELERLTLRTDAFGAVEAAFTAPVTGLSGPHRIAVSLPDPGGITVHGGTTVRVEAYKRPRFEVTFDGLDGTPALGDTVRLRAAARAFAGTALAGAEVRWRVTREPHWPIWCWTGYGPFRPGGRGAAEMAQGRAVADDEGGFTVAFPALPGEDNFTRGPRPHWRYRIRADVTDAAGETRGADHELTIGPAALRVAISGTEGPERLPETWIREEPPALRLALLDAAGDARAAKVTARLIALEPLDRRLRERAWEVPDQRSMDREAWRARLPHDPWGTEFLPSERRTTRVAWEREWAVPEGGGPIAFPESPRWPAGPYVLFVFGEDAAGRDFGAEYAVDVRTRDDDAVPATAWVAAEGAGTLEPGATWRARTGSPVPGERYLVELRHGEDLRQRAWRTATGRWQTLEHAVTEADRGGLDLRVYRQAAGTWHAESVRLEVPWTNKALTLRWSTFRDRLEPGARETWRVTVSGPDGGPAEGQLLAAMYDASLDALAPHGWPVWGWTNAGSPRDWTPQGSGSAHGFARPGRTESAPSGRRFDRLLGLDGGYVGERYRGLAGGRAETFDMAAMSVDAEAADLVAEADKAGNGPGGPPAAPALPPPRRDFRETAFFFGRQALDEGTAELEFTVPEALTRWNVWLLAHDAQGRVGRLETTATTSRELMVTPNFPRYLRAGDRIVLGAKVDNTGALPREGTALLTLEDAETGASRNAEFGLPAEGATIPWSAAPGGSAALNWLLAVPEAAGVIRYTVTAQTEDGHPPLGDGESDAWLLVPNRTRVLETHLLPVPGPGEHRFTDPGLLAALSGEAPGTTERLTLTWTGHPAWFAVQALPYLMDPGQEHVEATFQRLYANAVGHGLALAEPRIADVFARWRGTDALASPLEKHEDLRGIALAETPWLREAQDESAARRRLGLLLDPDRMAYEERGVLDALLTAQDGGGGWPWFAGGRPNAWVTRTVLTGAGQLRALGFGPEDPRFDEALGRAWAWIDAEDRRAAERRLASGTAWADYVPGAAERQALYARSFFEDLPVDPEWAEGLARTRERAAATWQGRSLREQAWTALAQLRAGDRRTAEAIGRSLVERAQRDPELGVWWPERQPAGGAAPIETQALLVELFTALGSGVAEAAFTDGLRTWLLQQKRGSAWGSTLATARACQALLLPRADGAPTDWLAPGAERLTVGDRALDLSGAEAGTGFVRTDLPNAGVTGAARGVTVEKAAPGPAWGAVYRWSAQPLDAVAASGEALTLTKALYRERHGPRGIELVPASAGEPLRRGEVLVTRLTLTADRDLEFVHLRDARAAGLEPMDALSGHGWSGGLSWYASPDDAGQDWFFERLPRGTHVFEHRARAFQPGDFAAGPATVQALYAPEFAARSAGGRLRVEAP